jgi:hypothetical protein
MSSKKQEREALRLDAARSIRRGWKALPLKDWKPREDKPKIKHLRAAALERNPRLPELRTSQDYVNWLSTHDVPDDAVDGASKDGDTVLNITFNELG